MRYALDAFMEALPEKAWRPVVLMIHHFLLQLAKTLKDFPPETIEFIESQRPIRIDYLPQKLPQKRKRRK
jgi:hypothetical protein